MNFQGLGVVEGLKPFWKKNHGCHSSREEAPNFPFSNRDIKLKNFFVLPYWGFWESQGSFYWKIFPTAEFH
ncbi:hypothetical protein OUZ56_024209 [Daphnia magna]|uniref:Uncharacterized protein n=1 Tax=Daphnia magna TaxID=35525 RepID=A0ABR0B0H0_9CRUS|nr:hypothetical protein OUZ56_024209 [Daphnia magna]